MGKKTTVQQWIRRRSEPFLGIKDGDLDIEEALQILGEEVKLALDDEPSRVTVERSEYPDNGARLLLVTPSKEWFSEHPEHDGRAFIVTCDYRDGNWLLVLLMESETATRFWDSQPWGS